MNIGFELKESIAALEAALLSKHPTMPTLLGKIHGTLQQYPEQVVLLTEQEICLIFQGLQAHTTVVFADSVVKAAKVSVSSKAGKAKLLSLLDD